jgi:hypothetical protein
MAKLALALALGLLISLLPGTASAKGIPIPYHTGQKAFATGPLPPPFDQEPKLAGFQAGYICDIHGVVWTYFSVSNCKPVAFKDDTYADDPEIVAAITAKYTESDMQRGIWGRFGWMLIALAILAGVALWVKDRITGGDEKPAPAAGA